MSPSSIAPCPFCGFPSSRVMEAVIATAPDAIHGHYVACGDCGARGPLIVDREGRDGRELAVFNWNLGSPKYPHFVIKQRVATVVEEWGLVVNDLGKKCPSTKWESDPLRWTRMGLDDAASLMVNLTGRGFNVTLEVAP